MFHQRGEIALTGRFLQDQAAVQTIAPFELVADHQATAVAQQAPDSGVEIPRHLLQCAHANPMLKPVAAARGQLQRVGHFPLHTAAHMELLSPLQGRSAVVHIAEQTAQAIADEVRRFTAQRFEGFVLTQPLFGSQFRGEQQQQLAQLQRETALEQVGFSPRNAVERQQQFLLQHPFPAVGAAGAGNAFGDGAAVERSAQT